MVDTTGKVIFRTPQSTQHSTPILKAPSSERTSVIPGESGLSLFQEELGPSLETKNSSANLIRPAVAAREQQRLNHKLSSNQKAITA